MTDSISDMLNRIRNAQAVFKETVDAPFSNLKYEIAKILKKEGFIETVEKKGKGIAKSLKIVLKYQAKDAQERSDPSVGRGQPVISGLRRVSKPGQRIYASRREVKRVKGGWGIAIVSTSKGLMTGKEARKQKLGGEIICEIW